MVCRRAHVIFKLFAHGGVQHRVCCVYVFFRLVSHILPLMTTNAISSNPAHDEIRSIQHYVIEFVSDLREVGSFLWVLRFRPPIKLTATI